MRARRNAGRKAASNMPTSLYISNHKRAAPCGLGKMELPSQPAANRMAPARPRYSPRRQPRRTPSPARKIRSGKLRGGARALISAGVLSAEAGGGGDATAGSAESSLGAGDWVGSVMVKLQQDRAGTW